MFNFQLHDATRRLICRALFWLICVLPTLGVIAFCYARGTMGHVRAVEQELATRLGVLVRLVDVEHPRPGVMLLRGVELAEPEAHAPFFKARLIETAERGGTWVIVAAQPEIQGAQWPAVWELIGRRLRKQLSDSDQPIRFMATELTIHAADGPQTFTEIQGQLDGTADRETLLLNFRLAGVAMPETAKLRIARDRRESPPRTSVELHTGGAALPCQVLLSSLGGAERLGDRAAFHGSFWMKDSAQGWSGELSGQIQNIDLTRLVADHFPHHLSGPCQVHLHKVKLQQGRVEEGAGQFVAGPGVIGRSLLEAAYQHMGFIPGKAADQTGDLTRYDELAFSFVLDGNGLTLAGQCRDGPPGEVLNTSTGGLLLEPAAPRPVVDFIRMLAPANDVQVPATRESDWLSQRLPVPQLVRPENAAPKPSGLKLNPPDKKAPPGNSYTGVLQFLPC